jgi:hypothetical protein
MEKLFHTNSKKDLSEKKHSESFCSYLNRSSRPEIELIRSELERWFSRFPQEGKSDLIGRFNSDDDRNFMGAFFELYCFELLEKQGYSVELHAEVDRNKCTRPDFLVCLQDRPLFYMECKVYGLSDADYSGEARYGVFYETIEGIESPNFFIGINRETEPAIQISSRKVKRELEKWLLTLDPDEVMRQLEKSERSVPSKKIPIEGWEEVEFFAIPKRRALRRQTGGITVAMDLAGAHSINCKEPLMKALKSKASKYGVVELPYVIAVNAIQNQSSFSNQEDVEQVLFGEIRSGWNFEDDSPISYREPNGFWIKNGKPNNTRVSAILAGIGINPWLIHQSSPLLWHNPWAEIALDDCLWKGEQKVFDHIHYTMEDKAGLLAREILEIKEDWLALWTSIL